MVNMLMKKELLRMKMLKAISLISIASLSILSACNSSENESTAMNDYDSSEASNTTERTGESTSTSENSTADNNSVEVEKEPAGNDQEEGSLTTQEVLQETVNQLNTEIPIWAPATLDLSEEQHLTATTISTETSYQVELYSLDEPTPINNQALSDENSFFLFGATSYKNEDEAIKNIQSDLEGYLTFEGETEEVDLGYDITGQVQAGTGHSGVAWNEGNWELRSIANGNQIKEPEPVAKEVVDLLETITLPAPDELGSVFINQDQEKGTLTEVYWQTDSQVFKAQSSSLAPEEVLRIVSTMEEW